MRLQITTGDRRRVAFVGTVIVRLAAIALVALALMLAAACVPSQLLREQCPESPRTYCPAQHVVDTNAAKRGGR